ncbi:hypothetical protein MKA48_02735 [[Clostridium] innocuum]|nr:hypothetical protein [[Clostridium] innocuum]
MKNGLKLMIILLSSICLSFNRLTILASDIPVESENDTAFTTEEILLISSKYDVPIEYVQQYNSLDFIEKKIEILNNMESTITVMDMGNYIIKKYEKVVYLDENNKLPISIVDTQEMPNNTSNVNTRSTMGNNLKYTSQYNQLMRTYITNVIYNNRVNSLSDIRVEIIDTYGTYSGMNSATHSSAHSTGWRGNDAWARTSFLTYDSFGLTTTYLIANTSYNTYGTWKTEWID